MKPTNLLFLLLSVALFIMGESQVIVFDESYPLVEKEAIKNFSVVEGVYDNSFKLTNNESWNMKISIPEMKENVKVPLIIALHWAGDQNTYQDYGDCLVFPALDTLKGIIIVPSSDGLHWIDPRNEHRVIDLIQKIMKYWSISRDKVLITGYSNGGIGVWSYVSKYPKLFSAGIPMAGMYDKSKIKVPLYVVHGKEDELFSCREIESIIGESIKKGSTIELQIVNGKSHFMACNYVNVLKEKALEIKNKVFEN